jgi:S-DNA-T family DNA segregation ATPase FtsK/SpoIIIE
VVVVDEFATLAADLPGFVPALVGIAQRGRSLGIHLLLATQRPGAAVTDDIRANTNLRIALRLQDRGESMDVVGVPDAAVLSRAVPGRAVVRLGAGDHHLVQTATASGPPPAAAPSPVIVVEAPPGWSGPAGPLARPDAPHATARPDAPHATARTTLNCVVAAAVAAATELGLRRPSPPWLEPLPERLDAAVLPAGTAALADEPDAPAQHHVRWRAGDGSLLLCGATASGTTTALRVVITALHPTDGSAGPHAYVVDADTGALADLEALDHVGAVIGAADRERQARLVGMLVAEHQRRAAGAPASPRIVLAVDRLDTWRASLDEPSTFDVLDGLDRLIAGGSATGIEVVASVARPGALPASVVTGFASRWVFRLSDAHEAALVGVAARDVPGGPPGRCVLSPAGWTAQVVWPSAVPRATSKRASPVPTIGVLPSVVPYLAPAPAPAPAPDPTHAAARALGPTAASAPPVNRPWRLPIGIADADLGRASLALHDGDHLLVAGPAGSGRTTALRLIASLIRAVAPSARLYGLAGRSSRLLTDPVLDAAAGQAMAAVAAIVEGSARPDEHGPGVILVDDADWLDEPILAALLSCPRPSVHVVAAARPDVLRGLHGHWLGVVRRRRLGVLLQPALDLDGDLLGAALPRRQIVPAMPGRGYLVADGRAALVHLALPPDADTAGAASTAATASTTSPSIISGRPHGRATAAAVP